MCACAVGMPYAYQGPHRAVVEHPRNLREQVVGEGRRDQQQHIKALAPFLHYVAALELHIPCRRGRYIRAVPTLQLIPPEDRSWTLHHLTSRGR